MERILCSEKNMSEVLVFSDLRIAEKEILAVPNFARNYYIHLLPVLPWWTNRTTKYKEDALKI